MRLLLDTHALIWAAQLPDYLSADARSAIEDGANEIYASAASAFEIATKYRSGKLAVSPSLAENFSQQMGKLGFAILSISADHGQRAGLLRIAHKDPWDRMLIAQSQIEGMKLVSNERLFDNFGVPRHW